jgi:hypothetical protein
MALGSTQPLTEMSTRNFFGRPSRKADDLTSIYEPTVKRKCGSFDVSHLHSLHDLLAGIITYFTFFLKMLLLQGSIESVYISLLYESNMVL